MKSKKGHTLIGVSKTYRFKHSEHSEQVGFVNWFRAKYPHTLIFAIPKVSDAKKVKVHIRWPDGVKSEVEADLESQFLNLSRN